MMQELQGIENRCEGESGRTWKKSGTSARDVPRVQRRHMLQVGEREKIREKSDALRAAVAQCKLPKILTWTRRSTRAKYTQLGIPGSTTESPVATWGAHDDVSQGKFPSIFGKWEGSFFFSVRPVSDFSSNGNVASNDIPCVSWNTEVLRFTKEVTEQEEDSWTEPLALLICSSTIIRNKPFATLYTDRKSWFIISAVETRIRQSRT